MRALVVFVSVAFATFFTFVATTVSADEECYKGFRSPTSEEQVAMQAVLDSALRALPMELPGWVQSTDDQLSVSSQCMDDGPRPWSYVFSRSFERTDDREQHEAMLEDVGTQYQAARQANQPATDAVMARIQELSQAAVAAAQAGDYAKVEEINVEIEQASAQYEALMQGANAELDAANDEANRDRSIRIAVEVNPGYEMLGYESRTVTEPAGASHAFRWKDTTVGSTDETELVLLGSWRKAEDSYDQAPRAGVAQVVPQAISVRITADENRIASVLDSIDFTVFAALLSR
jgi:hypothetical protein